MASTHREFYKVGGPLAGDAQSYVVRDADNRLFEALKDGNYCYVLTSRQMGKTSLLRRTALRLRDVGLDVAELDLSATGKGSTVDEWYYTLLITLCRSLSIDRAQTRESWKAHEGLTPASRYLETLAQLIIPRVQERLTIFVDELDMVRSLHFSADDFFMGIRACYNRRAEDPVWNKINFCLLGVTSPADLISDPLITPFNIGQRIALHDFTFEEAVSLSDYLGQNPATNLRLFRQIYDWTNGHPYLTQNLCKETAVRHLRSTRQINHLCHELFFDSRMDKDANLEFVGKELARDRADIESEKHEEDLAGRLDLYRRILVGDAVRNEETRPHVTHLNLSGVVVAAHNGNLTVRNRIYERAFDAEWIKEKMPDAEARRQKAARRRGFVRAMMWASLIIAVFVGLSLFAFSQRGAANERALQLQTEARKNRRLTYSAIMMTLRDLKTTMDQRGEKTTPSFKLLNASVLDNMQELLNQVETQVDSSRELRGFEFGYFKRYLSAGGLLTLRGHNDEVVGVAFSPDGSRLASTSLNLNSEEDNRVKIWDARSGALLLTLHGHHERVWSVAWSPDNARVATASSDQTIEIWDAGTGRALQSLQHGGEEFSSVAWSPDGKYIAGGESWSGEHSICIWEAANGKLLKILSGHKDEVYCLAWSPDGRYLASGSWDSTVKVWLTAEWSQYRSFAGHTDRVYGVAWSPDGTEIATASYDKTIRVWSIATSSERPFLKYPRTDLGGEVYSIAWSPDGKRIATGHYDGTINVWDAATGSRLYIYSHDGEVRALAFSPDGERLASASQDQTVRVWGFGADGTPRICHFPARRLTTVAWSTVKSELGLIDERGVMELWDISAGVAIKVMKLDTARVRLAGWSPNGELLATVSQPPSATEGMNSEKHPLERLDIWDPRTGTKLFSLEDRAINGMAWAPDGQRLAFSSGITVKVYDVKLRATETQLLPDPKTDVLPNGYIYHLAWSPDNHELAAAYESYQTTESSGRVFSLSGKPSVLTTIIWDLETKRARVSFSGSSKIHALAWSPTGKQIATGDEKAKITIWSTIDGKSEAILHGHTGIVRALSWSSDGKRLASASADRSIRVWDPESAAALLTFDRQPGTYFVGWLTNDSQLAAVRADGTVVIWNGHAL